MKTDLSIGALLGLELLQVKTGVDVAKQLQSVTDVMSISEIPMLSPKFKGEGKEHLKMIPFGDEKQFYALLDEKACDLEKSDSEVFLGRVGALNEELDILLRDYANANSIHAASMQLPYGVGYHQWQNAKQAVEDEILIKALDDFIERPEELTSSSLLGVVSSLADRPQSHKTLQLMLEAVDMRKEHPEMHRAITEGINNIHQPEPGFGSGV